jgi:CTP synthase
MTEFAPDSPYPVIDLMPDQHNIVNKGGTMRLGRFPCHLQAGTISAALYKEPVIYERHRHRYEVNNTYREELKKHGMVFAGVSPDDRLVEMIELTNHPYFVACQFHPELKSRPDRPHPLFVGFVDASLNHSEAAEKKELESGNDAGSAAPAVSAAQEKAAPLK